MYQNYLLMRKKLITLLNKDINLKNVLPEKNEKSIDQKICLPLKNKRKDKTKLREQLREQLDKELDEYARERDKIKKIGIQKVL